MAAQLLKPTIMISYIASHRNHIIVMSTNVFKARAAWQNIMATGHGWLIGEQATINPLNAEYASSVQQT